MPANPSENSDSPGGRTSRSAVLPEIARDDLDSAGRSLYDEILAARGSISGPFGIWLHSPEFTRRATQLGEFLRYHTSLSPRLSELAILVTARCTNAPVEWAIHEPLARKAGLPEAVIAALAEDAPLPAAAAADEHAVHEFCAQLHRRHTADEAVTRQVVELLGAAGAVELTGICGYYTMVSMTLNAFRVSLPDS